MKPNISPIRNSLRFNEEVEKTFSFIIDFGFVIERSESTFVQFTSEVMSLNVYHGRRSFEIGLEVQSPSDPSNQYSISAVLQLLRHPHALQYRNFAARDVKTVSHGVSALSDLFLWCIKAGILNDAQLFTRLQKQRKSLSLAYELSVRLQQARVKVAEAWEASDYETVVRSFKPLESELSKSELQRLQFAERQSSIKNS